MAAWRVLTVVGLLALTSVVRGDTSCLFNTSLGFIVDTSESTDSVALTMKAALDEVASANGAVLAFQDYLLTTWMHPATSIAHFPTIQALKANFDASFHPGTWVNNERLTEPQYPGQHDDWAYMLDSLEQQVYAAQPNGFIVVLGDQDEVCDGRPHAPLFNGWYAGRYINAAYDARIPHIIEVAQQKNVRISFYYFVFTNWWTQTPGDTCPTDPSQPGNREWPMGQIANISQQTGGRALYNETLSDQMAAEVKTIGKAPAVCDTSCSDDSTLAIIVDTSGATARVQGEVRDLFAQLQQAMHAGTLKPFNHYLLGSWATARPTVLSYLSFGEMFAAVQQTAFYGSTMRLNDSDTSQAGNDWLYAVEYVKEAVNHVGVGGLIIIISDQEAFCDAGRYNSDPAHVQLWTEDLQLAANVAVSKKISLAWYMFQDGLNGDEPNSLPSCSIPSVQDGYLNAIQRAGELAVILAGESRIEIPLKTAAPADYTLAVNAIASVIVMDSQRPPCRNCSLNATLAFLVDTSFSADPLKAEYKWAFAQSVSLAAQLSGFTGGMELSTWELLSNQTLHFASVVQLNAYVASAQLASSRVLVDATHDHDDWRYMLETLPILVLKAGKDGYVMIMADDNQVCDALLFPHNSSEPLFVTAIAWAKQLHVKISYFQLATPDPPHYCSQIQMVPGRKLAWMLANATGGSTFFGVNASNVRNDVFAHLLPALADAGAHTTACPLVCPPGTELAFLRCQPVNPCDVLPCKSGATCIPQLHTASYTCHCPNGFYGSLCQFPCVPHSYFNQTNHALAMVLDTSDSTAFAINGMKSALQQLVTQSLSFDEFFLSTWAYLPPHAPLVKAFPTAADVLTELSDANAGKNERTKNDSGLATHNDWKYMLDSVEATLPLMGQNGVLLVVTDFEGVCDANPDARLVNGVTRYPMNPDWTRVSQLNTLAQSARIKIFFFTFPSSDYGWCSAAEKTDVGLAAAQQLVAWTGGHVEDVPGWLSAANTQTVVDELNEAVHEQAGAQRCDCPPPYVLDVNSQLCQL